MDLSRLIDKQNEMADWIIGDITHVCKDFETRSPGTKGELQAAEYYGDLLTQYGCDYAKVESFKENPGSFFGWITIAVTLTLIAVGLYFVAPVISVILTAFTLVLAVLQFGLYIKFVDKLFPEKTGHNVTAMKKPTGTVERRIIFNGHLDAAWEWPVNYALGGIGFEGHAVLGFGSVIYYLVFSVFRCVKDGLFGTEETDWLMKVGLWGLLFVPFMIGLYWMWNRHRIVDGANDNLTGCEMGVAIVKALHEEGIEFEHTEVGVVLTGSEEAGLRGAKAWCEAHKGEFDDVPTFIFSYDTIHDPKWLMANYRDLNGTVKADKDVSDLFMEACAELEIPCRKGWVPPLGGATDNAAFAQAGMRSTGITGLNHKLESYYHTRKDSYDNLSKQGIAECYACSVKALEMFDAGAKQ